LRYTPRALASQNGHIRGRKKHVLSFEAERVRENDLTMTTKRERSTSLNRISTRRADHLGTEFLKAHDTLRYEFSTPGKKIHARQKR
jgi:hypothetical protein